MFSINEKLKFSNESGNGYGLYYGFQPKNTEKIWHLIQVEYRYMKSGRYIDDNGYGKGSNYQPYSEYTEEYHNFGISYKTRILFFKNERIEFIGEIDYYIKPGKRYYTVSGLYAMQVLSEKVVDIVQQSPFIRA